MPLMTVHTSPSLDGDVYITSLPLTRSMYSYFDLGDLTLTLSLLLTLLNLPPLPHSL